MRPRISIRWSVRPSVGLSVRHQLFLRLKTEGFSKSLRDIICTVDDIKREKNIKMEIHVHKLRETAIIFDQFSLIIEHWQSTYDVSKNMRYRVTLFADISRLP